MRLLLTIEAATALADQHGNEVTLSYRRASFFRLKRRNQERIEAYAAQGRIRLLLSSQVRQIEEDHAVLAVTVDGVDKMVRVPGSYTFVLGGGEPPYQFLGKLGIRFGGDASGTDSGSAERVAVEV